MPQKNIRPIAIHLPQFHPTPENDKWWGKGFTEWRNVTKARPLFKGHYQPHLPADLGFYDLRLEEARLAQEAMAKKYGIYGFCYYHYWFNGKRLLYEPLDRKMNNPKEDLPFMLCWANENWSSLWNGGNKEILLEQTYSEEDHKEHIHHLLKYFKDSRYIKVNGKPVFAVYRSKAIPDVGNAIRVWRNEASKEGIELYLCRIESMAESGRNLVNDIGFDAAIEFQPFSANFYNYRKELLKLEYKKSYFLRTSNKLLASAGMGKLYRKRYLNFLNNFRYQEDYNDYVNYLLSLPHTGLDYKLFPGITPSWDNTSRKSEGYMILRNANPDTFKIWLKKIKTDFAPFSEEENFLFINAWNEWAEGNHLEPCQKWGTQYLEAIKEVIG